MTARLCQALANWLRKRGRAVDIHRIDMPDRVYLERYIILKTRWLRIYLHRFRQSDADEVHDHPAGSLSFGLSGGYREHFHDGTYKDRHAPFVVGRAASTMHRLEMFEGLRPYDRTDILQERTRIGRLSPERRPYASDTMECMERGTPIEIRSPLFCWTLFFFGPRHREWGFATKQGWVPWQRFYDEHAELHKDGYWGIS